MTALISVTSSLPGWWPTDPGLRSFRNRSIRLSGIPRSSLRWSSSGSVLENDGDSRSCLFEPWVLERFLRDLSLQPSGRAAGEAREPGSARLVIRRRHDLFATAGGGQTTLCRQAAPGEQLVRGNAMPTSTKLTVMPGSKVSSTIRTFSDARAPPALTRRDDLNAIRKVAHRHGCMPHT